MSSAASGRVIEDVIGGCRKSLQAEWGRVAYLLRGLLVHMLCFVVLMKWVTYDLALVFLLLRFSLRVRFFLHLALILGCCEIC
jgi:hypothetical protein